MTETALLISNTSWSVYNFRRGLLAMLGRRTADVVVCAAHDSYSTLLSTTYRFVGLRALAAHGTNPFADLRLLIELVRLFRRLKPSIVFTFTVKPNIYGALAARLTGVKKLVCTVNGLGRATASRGCVGFVTRLLYRLSIRHAAGVVFQNASDRTWMVRRGIVVREKTFLTAGSGVDLEEFGPSISPKPTGQGKLLFFGRMLKSKGVTMFVAAARELKREFPACEFLLLGAPGHTDHDGVSLRQLERWNSEGFVRYLGGTQDVRPVLAGSHIVVLPSYYPEGVPRALIEALAAGKALITTDAPGCRETVDEGLNGYLVRPRNLRALVDAMRALILLDEESYRRMCLHSRTKAETEFDERTVFKTYETLLKEAG